MYILVILLPLLSSILIGLSGRWLGREGSAFISIFFICLTWILALFIFYEVCLYKQTTSIKLYQWFIIDIYNISFGLLFDSLSSAMIVVVTTISCLYIYIQLLICHMIHI